MSEKTKIKIADLNEDGSLMQKVAENEDYWNALKKAQNEGRHEFEVEGLEYETEETDVGGEAEEVVEKEELELETEDLEGKEITEEEPQEQEEREVEDGDGEVTEEEAKEAVEKLKIHYKWYGKEYDSELTPEEISNAYQKALKFPELKNEIESLKSKAEMIDKAGLTEEKIDFFNKLMSGDKDAVKQLLKKADIDPYGLEVDDVEPIEFKQQEHSLKVTEEVGKFLSEVNLRDPNGYKLFESITSMMPNSLLNVLCRDEQTAQAVYIDLINDRFIPTMRRIHERSLYDEELANGIETNYSEFLKVYAEEAKNLGYIQPSNGNGSTPQAEPVTKPKTSTRESNARRVKEKLKASTGVRGASAGGVKKTFDSMSPREQADYINSMSMEEFREFKKKRGIG